MIPNRFEPISAITNAHRRRTETLDDSFHARHRHCFPDSGPTASNDVAIATLSLREPRLNFKTLTRDGVIQQIILTPRPHTSARVANEAPIDSRAR